MFELIRARQQFSLRNRKKVFWTKIRGQTPSSMGESFFFSCTRHVSMYLRRGIVIHSFCPTWYYFLLVSSGRNVLSRVGMQGPTSAGEVRTVRHSVCRHAGADGQRKCSTYRVVSSSAFLACGWCGLSP
jgi:hypothetical protein